MVVLLTGKITGGTSGLSVMLLLQQLRQRLWYLLTVLFQQALRLFRTAASDGVSAATATLQLLPLQAT